MNALPQLLQFYSGLESLKMCKVDIRQNNTKWHYFSISNPLCSAVYALWKWASLLSEKSVISEKFSKMSSVFLVFLWLQDGFQLQLNAESKKVDLHFSTSLVELSFIYILTVIFEFRARSLKSTAFKKSKRSRNIIMKYN